MKEKIPSICCPTCGGRGTTKLEGTLLKTFLEVRRFHSLSAVELHSLPTSEHVSITAINNRLEDLRQLGLLDRIRNGRRWVYSIKTK